MNTKIRNLNKKDIPACLKIILESEAGTNKGEAKKLLEFSLAPGIKPLNPNYYVLECGGKVVGISGLYYDYEDPKNIMWMDYFAVIPGLQRQGHGTKMMQNLEKICKDKKIKFLCLFTYNEGALKFYKKNGFKICGRINNYYPDGKPRIWMYKTLRIIKK